MHWASFTHCEFSTLEAVVWELFFWLVQLFDILPIKWLILQIYPHGSTDTLPFATMGSGSLAAMSVFESKYKEGLSVS